MLNWLIRKQRVRLPTNNYAKPMIVRYTLRGLENYICLNHIGKEVESEDWHTHPWDYLSIVLWGGYLESTNKDGVIRIRDYRPLSVVRRKAGEFHALLEIPRGSCITLFIKLKTVSTNTRWRKNGKEQPEAAFWLKQGYNKDDLKKMFHESKEWIGVLE